MKNKPSPQTPQARQGFPGSSVFNAVPPPPRKKREPLPPIDLTAVEVAADTPAPQNRSDSAPEWPVLLARLTAAGLHSSPLPIAYQASLKAAVAVWRKAHGGKFVVRAISNTHLRIWRTE